MDRKKKDDMPPPDLATLRRKIGIRELKAHASEILNEVREQVAEYVVTNRGEPIVRLLPFEETPGYGGHEVVQQNPDLGDDVWLQLDSLGREIARRRSRGGSSDDHQT